MDNPATIFLLCVIVALVVGLNLTLFGLLRGDRRIRLEAAKWTVAADGGRAARHSQQSQLDELRRAVEQLQTPTTRRDDPPHA